MKMRKLVAMLMALMMLCCIIPFSAMAAGNSAKIDFTDIANRTAYSTAQQVWEQNGITVTNDKGASTSDVGDYGGNGYPARFYKSSTVVIEYPGITSIVIDCTSLDAKYVDGWSNSFSADATATVESGIVTIVLANAADSFTWEQLSAQSRAYNITVYTNGAAPEEPETPDAPAMEVVTNPEVGVAYKFGMIQEKVSATDVYYLIGGMSTYYMSTGTDVAAAIDVYLENAEDGYYMYTLIDGVKTYINMVVNGTYVNGAYEASASTVYTFDADAQTVIAIVNDAPYWFGTRNDKTYTTVGPCKTEYEGYYCRFYAVSEGGDTPVVPDQPDTPVVPDEPETPDGAAVLDLTDKANRVSYSTSQQVWQQNGITLTNDKDASTTPVADYANPGRFYKNSTVTLEYPGMTAIVIDSVTYDDNDYAAPWTAIDDANVTATVEDGNVTILFAEPVDSITWSPMTAQGRAYTITVYTGGAAPDQPDEPEIPDDPDQPTNDWEVVTEPDVDVAYKLGLYQTQKDAIYYFIGSMSGYYGATETDVSLAVDMYLESAEDGYYLYFNDANGAKQYIALVQSGTYYNFTYGAEGSVFSWDAELCALYAPCGDEICYMGTYGKYVTVGTLKTSMLSETDYIARLYAEVGATPDVPSCEHVYDDEYDADCNLCGEVREVPEKPIEYVGTIEVGTVEGSVGDTVQVAVTLPNNPGIISVKVKVHFDTAVLKLVGYEAGEFGGSYSWSSSLDEAMSKGYFIINWIDGLSADNTSELLATLSFEILEGAAEEMSLLTLEFSCESDIFNANDETVYLQGVNGGVVVVPAPASVPGDANCDGVINNRDLALMQQYINKWEGIKVDVEAMDVNDDGAVNNRDLALLQQYINKWEGVELV